MRTLASVVGVALAVALFASVAAFVDGSATAMSERALAHVSVDFQVGLHTPLSPTSPSVPSLQRSVAATPTVAAADPFASLDLGTGSLSAKTTAPLTGATSLFAFDPAYLRDFPIVRVMAGEFLAGGTLLSAEAASALGVKPGDRISVRIPGLAAPLDRTVTGIADLSGAAPLFAGRSRDTQGEYAYVPNVVVLDYATFDATVMPALRADAATPAPALRTPPVVEIHVLTDRVQFTLVDPATALTRATALRRTIERIAPGETTVIDNISGTLTAAHSDIVLAKILFLFLGIPGVLLAAYLAHYAAGVLAQSQRRELATLRARGASPAHLLRALGVETVAIGLLGAVGGLALAAVVLTVLFGRPVPAGAGPETVVGSALLAVLAGFITTALALYVPRRFALLGEAANERRELASVGVAPFWLRARLDLVLIAIAAFVELVTVVSGGFRPTTAEGQSVSLSLYTLLAPLLLWAGLTLLGVRSVLFIARRRAVAPGLPFGPLVRGLARRALARRGGPFAAGLIALSLAVGFGTSLSLFVSTYQQHQERDARYIVGADVRITPSTQAPRPLSDPTIVVPGVREATAVISISDVRVGNDKRAMAAVDPAAYLRVAAPADSFFVGATAAAAFATLSDLSAVLVSDELAKTFNILPGDRVMLQLPRADGTLVPITFHATGMFTNVPGFPQGIDLIADRNAIANTTARTSADFFLIRTTSPDPSTLAAVAATLRSGAGGSALLIHTSRDAFSQDQSTLAALNVAGLGGIETIFTAILSAAAAAIFVTSTLVQRRKEYVTLRAIGMRTGQLRRLLAFEAGLFVALGLLIGGLVGVAMAVLFVQILAPLFVIAPTVPEIAGTGLIVLGGVVIAGTAAATAGGAIALARLRPVELLREE